MGAQNVGISILEVSRTSSKGNIAMKISSKPDFNQLVAE